MENLSSVLLVRMSEKLVSTQLGDYTCWREVLNKLQQYPSYIIGKPSYIIGILLLSGIIFVNIPNLGGK